MLDLAAARAAWPDIELSDEVVAAYIAEHAGNDPIEKLDVPALYLACACLRDDKAALAAFERTYLAPLRLTRVGDATLLDEVKQLLRIKLFVGDVPTITRYRRGSLAAWLRVVASRLAIDLLRQRTPGDTEHHSEPLLSVDDPALAMLKVQYREQVSAAFAQAIAALPAADRAMMRFALVDNVPLDRIGRIYQLSKSAVSRRLARARMQMLADVRSRLTKELGIATTELDSLVLLLGSQLHLSLPRLLGAT
ncbi:MAG: sigma-70 family RNA polymerase sigma factor [Kofleriaceae bacterium]